MRGMLSKLRDFFKLEPRIRFISVKGSNCSPPYVLKEKAETGLKAFVLSKGHRGD